VPADHEDGRAHTFQQARGIEHRLVRPGDLSRLDAAFFTMNGIMSLTVFGFAVIDRVVSR